MTNYLHLFTLMGQHDPNPILELNVHAPYVVLLPVFSHAAIPVASPDSDVALPLTAYEAEYSPNTSLCIVHRTTVKRTLHPNGGNPRNTRDPEGTVDH
jgi:hypothetical protein